MNRRNMLMGGLALLAGTVPAAAEQRKRFNFRSVFNTGVRRATYKGKRVVTYKTAEKPGTILVDANKRKLYFVMKNDKALEYGVGVGRAGFEWSGTARVGRKAVWPAWHPPKEMIARELKKYGRRLPDRMEGGPNNPLGARALYLFEGGKDTLYRIHGTNQPRSIGTAQSSGCIRMLNEEVIDLYNRTKVGAKVIVI